MLAYSQRSFVESASNLRTPSPCSPVLKTVLRWFVTTCEVCLGYPSGIFNFAVNSVRNQVSATRVYLRAASVARLQDRDGENCMHAAGDNQSLRLQDKKIQLTNPLRIKSPRAAMGQGGMVMFKQGMLYGMPRLRTAAKALPAAICLIWTAVAAAAVNPHSLTFPNTPVGSTSSAMVETYTNLQATPMTINSITASGSHSVTTTDCPLAPATLAPTLSCSVSVEFAPTVTGFATGRLTFDYNAGSTAFVGLYGSGIGVTTSVTPSTLGFGQLTVGTTSAAQSVTFTNNTAAAIGVGPVAASGDYLVNNNACPSSLGSGLSCGTTRPLRRRRLEFAAAICLSRTVQTLYP